MSHPFETRPHSIIPNNNLPACIALNLLFQTCAAAASVLQTFLLFIPLPFLFEVWMRGAYTRAHIIFLGPFPFLLQQQLPRLVLWTLTVWDDEIKKWIHLLFCFVSFFIPQAYIRIRHSIIR